MARAEDGGTITTTEIEFSHQSSRCEESACTHASIRPASRISRVSTGCASGEREGVREKRAAASEKDGGKERESEKGIERGKEGTHGSVLPAPFVSATRYIRMGARRLPRKAKPATARLYAIPAASASLYLPRETKHGEAPDKKKSLVSRVGNLYPRDGYARAETSPRVPEMNVIKVDEYPRSASLRTSDIVGNARRCGTRSLTIRDNGPMPFTRVE